MPPISEDQPAEKMTSPETVSEANKGWQFTIGSLAVAWGAKFGLASATWLPMIVVGFVLVLPPIFAIVGLIHTIGAWKNHSKINGMLVPALLGTIFTLPAIASILFLLLVKV